MVNAELIRLVRFQDMLALISVRQVRSSTDAMDLTDARDSGET